MNNANLKYVTSVQVAFTDLNSQNNSLYFQQMVPGTILTILDPNDQSKNTYSITSISFNNGLAFYLFGLSYLTGNLDNTTVNNTYKFFFNTINFVSQQAITTSTITSGGFVTLNNTSTLLANTAASFTFSNSGVYTFAAYNGSNASFGTWQVFPNQLGTFSVNSMIGSNTTPFLSVTAGVGQYATFSVSNVNSINFSTITTDILRMAA